MVNSEKVLIKKIPVFLRLFFLKFKNYINHPYLIEIVPFVLMDLEN